MGRTRLRWEGKVRRDFSWLLSIGCRRGLVGIGISGGELWKRAGIDKACRAVVEEGGGGGRGRGGGGEEEEENKERTV